MTQINWANQKINWTIQHYVTVYRQVTVFIYVPTMLFPMIFGVLQVHHLWIMALMTLFNSTRNPSWVLEYIDKDKLQSNTQVQRSLSTFKTDPQIPEKFRVHPNKFLNSGYDKGHLAPASNLCMRRIGEFSWHEILFVDREHDYIAKVNGWELFDDKHISTSRSRI